MRQATIEELNKIKESQEFQALMEQPGFRLFIAACQDEVVSLWKSLLSIKPEELKGVQGCIDGINFVLEYANARVQDGNRVVESLRDDQASALEAARTIEKVQRERAHRSSRLGSDIS